MNSHCVQINEWKALNFVFERNERTKKLFTIIDRYESTVAAAELQGANDGDILRTEEAEFATVVLAIDGLNEAIIEIEDGQIVELSCAGLQDNDIVYLQYLPKQLKLLDLSPGTLTHIDMGALPRGLEYLTLRNNKIHMMMIKDSPPLLKELDLDNNPLEKAGIIFKLPLPQNLELKVSVSSYVCLGDARWQRFWSGAGVDGYFAVIWPDGTRLKVYTDETRIKELGSYRLG